MKHILTVLIILTSILMAKPKFTDKQIAAMTPQYFSRNHTAPKLTGLKIYTDGGERIYHVEIKADRNRSSEDLSLLFLPWLIWANMQRSLLKNMWS